MKIRNLHYYILIPLLTAYSLFFWSQNTSEFDWDNFDFKEEHENKLAENYVNTFSDSEAKVLEEETEAVRTAFIDQEITFTSQAPLAEWSDPRQQDGCEEASVIMAMSFLGLEDFKTLTEAKEKIIDLATWQTSNYDSYIDTSAMDTNKRLINEYYKYDDSDVIIDAKLDDIKKALWQGNIVLAPCDGRKLNNPNFTQPGPERHMLVIRGYDEEKKDFITNDPGTRKGEAYRYNEDILFGAIRDYPSGDRKPILSNEKNVIIIRKGL
jgi:hypothetical protein